MRSDFRGAVKKSSISTVRVRAPCTEALAPFSGTDFCPAFGRSDCTSASPLKGEDSIEEGTKTKKIF
jgi:hypothetical protein